MAEVSVLDIKSVSKEFSGVTVLRDVSLSLKKGEILGLIGENGAGKSTLIKIISGIYKATRGSLFLGGIKANIKDAQTAKQLGISMVPQEFNLIDTLNVYENIFLGSELRKKNGFLNKQAMRDKARELLDDLETEISVESKIADLSVAEKQMVEVSKAMIHHARILIFDEPTTTLTGHEINILFALMNRLKDQGVTMIFVSHKLGEVKRICDRVAVLRDGDLISVDSIEDMNEKLMAQRMVGRELSTVFPPKSEKEEGDTVLDVIDFNIPGKLKNINFTLKRGEILGLAGLVGAGRTETAEAIMGLREKETGSLKIHGRDIVIDNPRTAVENRLGYISEDRQGRGIHLVFDIPGNVTLITLKKYQKILIDKKRVKNKAREYMKIFNIKAPSLFSELKYLSGGNQQKVYLSKWMETNPEILILDEPTRGIDIKAKGEIYRFIQELVKRGISLIIISSELEEIIGLCNRVYVLREGRITGELTGDHLNEEEIMFYATGVKEMGSRP